MDRAFVLKAFGKRLKDLRIAKGFTQQRLGEEADLSYKYIGEIERGEKNPTICCIYKISDALGISLAEIFLIEECNPGENQYLKRVEKLFEGREESEIKKAIKILEVFFE